MRDSNWYAQQARLTLKRLLPRLEERFKPALEGAEWLACRERLDRYFPALFESLYHLYGSQYDFFYHLEQILVTAINIWFERPDDLKALDATREADPLWFQSHRMLGAVCYVDLFSGNLQGIREKIPYLLELGVTYLHLMPIFRCPEGDDDGGYAISSYREVDPKLGDMAELSQLACELRHHGISLVLDFVFNHTSDEHAWAKEALAGDPDYQNFYRTFPDRTLPDLYERTIKTVFPDERPGSFTYNNRIRRWIWTTFHNYQWDLNYENPAVFNAMAEEMLFLANQGVEILRLDAVAFIWKQTGTSCENLPQAHIVIQAFNALVRIAAPAMLFKSEAIVHPDEVIKYISAEECQLSYNPQLMALLWSTIASRDVGLLRHAMSKRFAIGSDCAWVNYVRCHDDIGWVFSNEDAEELHIDPVAHRRFLGSFFTGRFKGSFARGLPFQEDPESGDMRISGTCASLSGLEQAIELGDEALIDQSVRRILLLHAVMLTIGGIPLIYLGDELGMLNDYGYEAEAEKLGDTRWVHRPMFDQAAAELRHDRSTTVGLVFQGLQRLIQIRQQHLAFTRAETDIVDTGNSHVFGYFRQHSDQSVLVLANFSEHEQTLSARHLRMLGLRKTLTDLVAGRILVATQQLVMEPYQFMVLPTAR